MMIRDPPEDDRDTKAAHKSKNNKSSENPAFPLVVRNVDDSSSNHDAPTITSSSTVDGSLNSAAPSRSSEPSSALHAKQQAARRGEARKMNRKSRGTNNNGSNQEELSTLPQGSVHSTQTFPGAVAVQGMAPSSESSMGGRGSNHNDSFHVRGSGTEDYSHSSDQGGPAVVLTARLVQDEPNVKDFIEEQLERRMQEMQERVESQLRAQQQLYQNPPPPTTTTTTTTASVTASVTPTVLAEEIVPTTTAGFGGVVVDSHHQLPLYKNTGPPPSPPMCCGLRRRTLFLLFGVMVLGLVLLVIILRVVISSVSSNSPSSSSGGSILGDTVPPTVSPTIAPTTLWGY